MSGDERVFSSEPGDGGVEAYLDGRGLSVPDLDGMLEGAGGRLLGDVSRWLGRDLDALDAGELVGALFVVFEAVGEEIRIALGNVDDQGFDVERAGWAATFAILDARATARAQGSLEVLHDFRALGGDGAFGAFREAKVLLFLRYLIGSEEAVELSNEAGAFERGELCAHEPEGSDLQGIQAEAGEVCGAQQTKLRFAVRRVTLDGDAGFLEDCEVAINSGAADPELFDQFADTDAIAMRAENLNEPPEPNDLSGLVLHSSTRANGTSVCARPPRITGRRLESQRYELGTVSFDMLRAEHPKLWCEVMGWRPCLAFTDMSQRGGAAPRAWADSLFHEIAAAPLSPRLMPGQG